MFCNNECANIHFLTTVEGVMLVKTCVSAGKIRQSHFHCRGGPVDVCRGMFQHHTCVLLFLVLGRPDKSLSSLSCVSCAGVFQN